MAASLREARDARGWSSTKLQVLMREAADRLGLVIAAPASMRVMISRWVNGRAEPDPMYRLLLEEVFGLPATTLGLAERDDAERQAVLSLAGSLPFVPDVNPGLVDYFAHQLAEHVRLDNFSGPTYVIDTAAGQFRQVEQLAERGSPEMARLAARFAEFTGWLLQDCGDAAEALRITERSVDLAQAASDAELVTYNLMRKSNVLSSAGDRRLAVTTSTQALAAASEDFPELVPVCLRQHALASAQRGDERTARDAIERALALTYPVFGSATALSPYCTTSYVQMEAALSFLTLRQPAAAEQACAEALAAWPAELVRDRSLCLVRRAMALAELREVDEACRAALLAIDGVRSAPSGRVVHMLRLVTSRLRPFSRNPNVRELTQALSGFP